ncbi:hypothetical protein JCGZ_07234 [Jatropha curcas]|uniref:Uncharacterized protein n=1 Tax=Jatropha curcas TaxID=180498 RepID=A0A067KFA2_JATCU|nr:coiled-coil domain-containing protein 9 [Jatropha curcas]KDP33663.1 hypothetical protein JCGZ_07234 [Jatropha curcas]
MASICLSLCSTSKPLVVPPKSAAGVASSSSSSSPSCHGCRCSLVFSTPIFGSGRMISSTSSNTSRSRRQKQVVCMAPDEEKLTRRNPLDFPIEWERPKPGRRPDIFPQFSPMKTPIPPPLPYDPPEEDEEEEEEKKKEEEEEDPEKEEEPDKPEKQ